MMIQRMPFSEITKLDLVPQAILRKPLSYFQRHLHMDIVRGEDDLDAFEGAALSLNGTLPFALKHYAGYPENTTTIYLSGNVTDIDAITSIINTIVRELELNNEAVEWQRSDDPDL